MFKNENQYEIKYQKNNNFAVILKNQSSINENEPIMFVSENRKTCINYIAAETDTIKPTYYIIEDLSTWSNNDPIKSKFEQFTDLREAISKFKEYRNNDYDYTDGKAKTTMGVSIGTTEIDIIQVRNNQNHLVSDFIGIPAINTNRKFLLDMAKISSRIKFNKIELRKNKYGEKLKEPKLVDYKKWKNPYFTDNKIKKNKEISI